MCVGRGVEGGSGCTPTCLPSLPAVYVMGMGGHVITVCVYMWGDVRRGLNAWGCMGTSPACPPSLQMYDNGMGGYVRGWVCLQVGGGEEGVRRG